MNWEAIGATGEVLGAIAVSCFLLFFPKMDIESPGSGIMARRSGTVTAITDTEIRIKALDGYIILAIKWYIGHHGVGIKQARAAVDEMMRKL